MSFETQFWPIPATEQVRDQDLLFSRVHMGAAIIVVILPMVLCRVVNVNSHSVVNLFIGQNHVVVPFPVTLHARCRWRVGDVIKHYSVDYN